jgi:hypothetical protein
MVRLRSISSFEGPPFGRLQAPVAACLAAILEMEAGQVPVPDEQHPEPWTVWRNWLSQRGLGLAPIATPAAFHWAGPWLALLRAADGDGHFAAVAFGSPPRAAWHPLAGPETFDAVDTGHVIAPADVALWAPSQQPTPPRDGTVEAIVIGPDAEANLHNVPSARARAGRGLEGERYFERRGTFSSAHSRGHDLTLMEGEVLNELSFPEAGSAPRKRAATS